MFIDDCPKPPVEIIYETSNDLEYNSLQEMTDTLIKHIENENPLSDKDREFLIYLLKRIRNDL